MQKYQTFSTKELQIIGVFVEGKTAKAVYAL